MTAQLLPLAETGPLPARATGAPTCAEMTSASGERLPLKTLSVDTAIVGMTASSTVRQRFTNTGDTTVEVTYVFPLPAGAGITEFTARVADRQVCGLLMERGNARTDYEEALFVGKRAAIVEEDRPEVFSVRVGNLGPGEDASVEMLLTGPLAYQDGEATFRFPLVVAPRTTTGTPLSGDQTGAGLASDTDTVPDASRVTPPRLTDRDERPDLQISLTIDGGGLAVTDLRASLPTAVVEPSWDGITRLRVEAGTRADRDFVLHFHLDGHKLLSSALLVPDTEGEEGTWSVTVVPPVQTSTAPRDIVVVLDRSVAMDGWKMIAARRAAGRIVDMLDDADRFCVLAFNDQVETTDGTPPHLIEGSDRNRFAATRWLGSLTSRGGTEMAKPLRKAAELLADASQDRFAAIVLLTDGQVTGEDELLKSLASLIGRSRVYCVGIDTAVNAGFLDRLARLGSGRAELVESEARLDEVMTRLARTIGRPSLTEICVTAEGFETIQGSVTPTRPPDAFAGVPCVISGRYRTRPAEPGGSVALHLEATGPSGPFGMTVPAKAAPAAVAVRTVWARAIVRGLEDEYASAQADSGLPARLVAHSIRYGVLSRFSALVAVDSHERTGTGLLTEVLQPVELPSGPAAPHYPDAAPQLPGAETAEERPPQLGPGREAHRYAPPAFSPRAQRRAPFEPDAQRAARCFIGPLASSPGGHVFGRPTVASRQTVLTDVLTLLQRQLSGTEISTEAQI